MTGPYTQSTKIEYTKNPKWRKEVYPSEGSEADKEAGLLKDAGKQIPFAEKIVVQIQPEAQPRWLAFEKGKTDLLGVPKDNFDSVVIPGKG